MDTRNKSGYDDMGAGWTPERRCEASQTCCQPIHISPSCFVMRARRTPLRCVMRCHVLHAESSYPVAGSGMKPQLASLPRLRATGFEHLRAVALPCMPPTACPRESGGRPGPEPSPGSCGSPGSPVSSPSAAAASGAKAGSPPSRGRRKGGKGPLRRNPVFAILHVVPSPRFVPPRSTPSIARFPEAADPDSRVSCAGARARGRAFRAGAVCAPDCPDAPARASRTRGALRLLAESGAFRASAKGETKRPRECRLLPPAHIITQIFREQSSSNELFQK